MQNLTAIVLGLLTDSQAESVPFKFIAELQEAAAVEGCRAVRGREAEAEPTGMYSRRARHPLAAAADYYWIVLTGGPESTQLL